MAPKSKSLKLNNKKSSKTNLFDKYLRELNHSINNNLTISKATMKTMNDFLIDIFEKIAAESSELVRINKYKTLKPKEIEAAVKLLFTGGLRTCATYEGNRAVNTNKNY